MSFVLLVKVVLLAVILLKVKIKYFNIFDSPLLYYETL